MPAYFTTARSKLRALLGIDLVSDIDAGFQALAQDVDTKITSYSQGATGAKPAAGQANRFWRDTTTGVLYHDTGTEWEVAQTTQSITAATIAGPYGALTARTAGTEYEPSATRPTLVILSLRSTVAQDTITVTIGTQIHAETANAANMPRALSFVVPPGKKWKYAVSGGGTCKSSYLTL
jgi:hypothetical protein